MNVYKHIMLLFYIHSVYSHYYNRVITIALLCAVSSIFKLSQGLRWAN